MQNMTNEERANISGELEAIADSAVAISSSLLEGDCRASDAVIGNALHAIATHIRRIATDIGDFVPEGGKS